MFQIRTQDLIPGAQGRTPPTTLCQFKDLLEAGALITVEEARSRARILPFQ